MSRRKSKPKEEHEFLSVRVQNYSARVDASVNYEARDKRRRSDSTRIYKFGSTLELGGICSYPDDRVGERFTITVHSRQSGEKDLDATLEDCHVRNDDGDREYRKVRGEYLPVYDVPDGVGLIEKVRGEKSWYGWLWVPEQTVSQMLILLTTTASLYLEIHVRRIGRARWIKSLALQTTDPSEE